MVYAYFGLVNPSPGFFWLATNFGGGGEGQGASGTAHDTATKIAQSNLLTFSNI